MTDTIDLRRARALRLVFLGPTNTLPSRWRATWVGWPSEGGRSTSVTFSADQFNAEGAARRAAVALCDWLNEGAPGSSRKLEPTRVTVGRLAQDEWAVLVHTAETPR